MSRMFLLRPRLLFLRPAARAPPHYGHIFGVFVARSFAGPSKPPSPPPVEPVDTTPTISVVLDEIRAQHKRFQSKVTRTKADVNAAHLEDDLGLPSEGEARPRLLLDPARVSPPLAASTLVDEGTSPGRELRRPTGKPQLQATVTVPRAPPPRAIVYPRGVERLQVNFRPPPPPPPENVTTLGEDVPSPPPPTGPRFAESNTHRIKVLLEGGLDREKVEVKSRQLNIPVRTEKEPNVESSIEVPPPPPPSAPLLTSVVMRQKFKVVPLDLGGRFTKTTEAATSSSSSQQQLQPEQHQEEDGDGDGRNAHARRWRRLKRTMAALGVVATLVGGYLMVVVGSPKYDERGRLIRDAYSHLPLRLQYYNRVRDELERCKRMIKEPSRDKLLPDALEPPYYQPPYTLVLEFTDLLVHPEWTYQNGWRFKKRPGVDQFLEALYTRFEVVVYTAQMGMTVFPIMDALDGKNLISYKLVRDATNFVDGDHVKDLDKINRDLSKVVVVDWNESSVKLHKDNLFKIPRWEGNDDDGTLFDLAAFLIAISEWEVQDVRAVLQYYAQFENPLAKFKENQMQALQATQS